MNKYITHEQQIHRNHEQKAKKEELVKQIIAKAKLLTDAGYIIRITAKEEKENDYENL